MRRQMRSLEAGIIAAVIVIAAVLYTLFAPPAIQVAQDGTYLGTMLALGLEYPNEAARSAQFVSQSTCLDYDMGSILSFAQPSIAWPAALVRLMTAPFGQPFDTRLLACVYALIMGVGAALLVGGLHGRSRLAAIVSGMMLAALCTYGPAVGYLNSLYETGAVMAFAVLFLGMLTFCLCRDRGCGLLPAAGVIFTGGLLLRAQAQMIVLAPAVAVAVALCLWHCWPRKESGKPARTITALLCALLLMGCTQGVLGGFASSAVVNSDAANYLAVFQGYLTVSDDVAGDLAAMQLPEDCAQDVGRSYYEPEENFVRNPRDESQREPLLDRIGLLDRTVFCLTHPQRVVQMILDKTNHFYDAFNDRIVTTDGQTRYVRPSPLVLIDLLVPMAEPGTLMMWLVAAAALSLSCLLVSPRRTGMGKMCICLALLCLGMAAYLPGCMVMTGPSGIYMDKVLVFFFAWLGFGVCAVTGLCLMNGLLGYLAEQGATLRGAGETVPVPNVALKERRTIPLKWLMLGCMLICMAVGVWLLGPENHIGGVNNGDYGRMMAQLQIDWTPEMMTDYEHQAGIYVIEEYTFRQPFDPLTLTPADPSYSLIYPTALLRLWNALTGALFSTRTVAVMLFGLTALCILLVVRDLYPILGNLTLLPAACLIAMLLGENYIAWYNALFGESMVSTGVILTLSCAVHLVTMERGSKQRWLWLILLGVSIRVMTCSKAQMALALPGGLLLLAVLAIWHRPKGLMKLTAYALMVTLITGLVCWDTLKVYSKNDEVSARHTVWQSVFFGALMIAEDPDAAMAELGIAPEMKADIGKHAYYPDEDYVYAPLSEEANAAFYDQVDTMTMVGYYLRHPKDFLYMLDRAAQESVNLHHGFMAYTDETYPEHTALQRFTLWMNLRPVTACHAFWQYVLLYGAAVIVCLRLILRRKSEARTKLFAWLFLCIMCIGVFQYPLTVVGNGFADNNKQLYCFMLCHDLLVVFAGTVAARLLTRKKTAPETI